MTSVLGRALEPIAELKQFAAGDFSEQGQSGVTGVVADGFRDEVEEVTHAARAINYVLLLRSSCFGNIIPEFFLCVQSVIHEILLF